MRLQAMLHKTIVFITHDFDEAIRLADRIAIMQDGEVIQVATPEELVINPATSYVEEFTRHIPRSKVLTVRSIMSADIFERGDGIPATACIDDVAKQIVSAELPVPVVDESGHVIGSVNREAVIEILVGGDTVV